MFNAISAVRELTGYPGLAFVDPVEQVRAGRPKHISFPVEWDLSGAGYPGFKVGWGFSGVQVWAARTEGVDSDGDGATDWEEAIAGTDPTNRFSVFRITHFDYTATAGATIRWSSVTGRQYAVETSPCLGDEAAYSTVRSNVTAAVPENEILLPPVAGDAARVYRVNARRLGD